MINQPQHARLFDGRIDFRNRLEHHSFSFCSGFGERVTIRPRHPLAGLSSYFGGMFLQLCQIHERVCAAQLAGGFYNIFCVSCFGWSRLAIVWFGLEGARGRPEIPNQIAAQLDPNVVELNRNPNQEGIAP